jgi:hypothetical protein
LKDISRIIVGPEDLVSHLGERTNAADRWDTTDVTNWTQEQIAKRFFMDHGQIEKLVRIATTEGVEVALEHLDGTPKDDEDIHRAALRALDEVDERAKK